MYEYLVRPFNAGVKRKPANAAARPDRRTAILLAAEKLFAQRGFHAVTIRQIAQQAAVPLALVGYYFGAKQALFIAIFERWSPTIEARLDALRQVALAPADVATLPAIVQAFVQPVLLLRASAEGEHYAQLVARQLSQSDDPSGEVLRRFFDPLAHAFIAALQAALPWASRAQLAWGYQFMLGVLLHHLIDTRVHALSHGANTPAGPAAAPLLQSFIVGGLRAALAEPPSLPSLPASPPASPSPRANTRRPTP